jgi:hypothetical protein
MEGLLDKKQGCGSGLDPDSVNLWIRIHNPDIFLTKFNTKKV